MKALPLLLAASTLIVLVSCSHGSSVQDAKGQVQRPGTISVFDLAVGNCAIPPTKVEASLSKIDVMPCTIEHTLEVYELAAWPKGDDFPGDEKIKAFADARCADAFEGYVGTSYMDSEYYFTYLTPTARSWQEDHDRTIPCFVTTTGATLTSSVRGGGD